MNILYLTDDHLDYVSDPLYIGLSRLLGNASVVDYPYKASFHEPERKPWCLVQRPGRRHTRKEILDLLRDRHFDMVCLASFRPESLEECAVLHQHVPFPPMVFVDGSDDMDIRHDLVARYPIQVYFKRDYVWKMGGTLRDRYDLLRTFHGNRQLFERTVPLPLSIVLDALPDVSGLAKEIDVSYTGRASHPRRAAAVEVLSSMENVRFSGGLYASPDDRKYKLKAGTVRRLWTKCVDGGPASERDQERKQLPEAYYQEIAASKIALALRGGGRTASLRYFEIVAMGTMLLSDAPETVIPDDFVDRRHAVYCRGNLSNLTSLVRYYLEHDREREAIAAEGKAHLLKHHTCERRAEYFLNICARSL